MFEKGSKMYAITHQKCPRCHEGELWKNGLWFDGAKAMLTKADYSMHENCPVCQLKYEMEPGFWWGAMYMAYAFSSGALLLVAGVYLLLFKFNMPVFLMVIFVATLIGFLYNARLARAAFINLWISYDASFAKK